MDRNLKIGVIGLGLIGGSIFKALCALNCKVKAASKSTVTIKKAQKYSSNVSLKLSTLKDCDVIFVCTPMNITLEILDKLNDILPKSAIVTDVCSIKTFLTQKKYNFTYIPSHPMAGTEHSGFDDAFETLFKGAKWAITPLKRTRKNAIKKLVDIIKVLGATPLITTPEEHDKAVALISHMPMLVAQALFKNVQNNNLALKLASSGFRDMTRLALSNEAMANDMITLNSKNIQDALLMLYSSLGDLVNNDYSKQIKNIKINREHMYKDGKNVF